MNLQQATEKLVSRARANLAQRHSHNERTTLSEKQCLACGQKASIQEQSLEHLLFCDKDCQRTLRGLDHFLGLGMMRGSDAIQQVHPDVQLVDLPDDVLGLLFAYAYRFELLSLDEYHELQQMRTSSKHLMHVIDTTVFPSIRFICSDVLKALGPAGIIEFTGLEKLAVGKLTDSRGNHTVLSEMPVEAVGRFKALRLEKS